MGIVIGSMEKGLVAGLLIGWIARKLHSLPLALLIGLGIGALLALPFALGTDPATESATLGDHDPRARSWG